MGGVGVESDVWLGARGVVLGGCTIIRVGFVVNCEMEA
jgi:hypothetical protein